MATRTTPRPPPKRVPIGPDENPAPRGTNPASTPTGRIREQLKNHASATAANLSQWAVAAAGLVETLTTAEELPGMKADGRLVPLRLARMKYRRMDNAPFERFERTIQQHLSPGMRRETDEAVVNRVIDALTGEHLEKIAKAMGVIEEVATHENNKPLAERAKAGREAFTAMTKIAKAAKV